ncbi:hypothetical protein KP509_32G026900 [Ceratopteris richardii]|nr:hypothetical protein KP509_32G026900 [Ceratopteris richardii]
MEELKAAGNGSWKHQKVALEQWRKRNLEDLDTLAEETKGGKTEAQPKAQEAEAIKFLLTVGWSSLLGDAGFDDSPVEEIPSDAELANATIPGRPLPAACRGEPHTDYDGAAVRWGLSFHVESAADCCQACIDQAKSAKPEEMKCNIWVYCPEVAGCYSPDIYEHRQKECWLKQASNPRLNFKGKYSPEYRKTHPRAPVVVPWAAGVISLEQ